MSFEPQFSELKLTEETEIKTESVVTVCRLDVPTESVSKIVSLYATAFALPEKNTENVAGKTTFCLCYEDIEGSLKKYECKKDFALPFSLEKGQTISSCKVKAEKVEADLSGVNLSLSAIMTVSAAVSEDKTLAYLTGGDGIIINNAECEIEKNFGTVFGAFPITEEFELGYPVKAVLSHKAEIVPTAVQCGVGSVLMDAEVVISAILLQNKENSAIIKEVKTFPVRIEAEYDDAMPALSPFMRAYVKSFKTDVTVDETSEKSSVTLSLSIGYEVSASAQEILPIPTDAFSVKDNLALERGEFSFYKNKGIRCERQNIATKVSLGTLAETDEVVCLYNDSAEIVSLNIDNGEMKVVGAFTAETLIKSDGGYRTEKVQSPFNMSVDASGIDGEITVESIATDSSFKRVSGDEIEISFSLALTVFAREKVRRTFIKSIKADGEKAVETAGFSVYIALSGEDLWSLSKRLNVCPDELAEGNKELKFPLSGEERIVVYRKR